MTAPGTDGNLIVHTVDEEFLAFEHPQGKRVGDSWLVANGVWSDAVIGNVADTIVNNTPQGRYMVHMYIEMKRIGDIES